MATGIGVLDKLRNRRFVDFAHEGSISMAPLVGVVEGGGLETVRTGYTRELDLALSLPEADETCALYAPRYWRETPGDTPLLRLDDPGDADAVVSALLARSLDHLIPTETALHKSLSDRIGEALATVRDELATAESWDSPDGDARLLRTFHQMLLVRLREDSQGPQDEPTAQGPDGIPRLRAALSHHEPWEVIEEALRRHGEVLDSWLFAAPSASLAQVSAAGLQALVASLVEPYERLHIDFSLIRHGLPGRLWSSYLQNKPVPAGVGLFGVYYERNDERRKQSGHYTPPLLADHLVGEALGLLSRAAASGHRLRVFDPACGSGVFLVTAYARLERHLREREGRALGRADRERLLLESIFGMDVDEQAVELTRVQLIEAAGLIGSSLPALDERIVAGDSLALVETRDGLPAPLQQAASAGFDLVATNPPFIAQRTLAKVLDAEARQSLRRRFREVAGAKVDFSSYFLALATGLLVDGGVVAMVLPHAFLHGEGQVAARRMLESSVAVRAVYDFRHAHLFESVQYRTCAVVAGGVTAQDDDWVSVIHVRRPDADAETVLRDLDGGNADDVAVMRSRQPAAALQEGYWGAGDLIVADLRRGGSLPETTLQEAGAACSSGLQTGGNARMIFSRRAYQLANDGRIVVRGQVVPARYVPRVVRGAALRPGVVWEGERVLVPFEPDGAPAADPDVQELMQRLGGLPRNYQRGDLRILLSPKVLIATTGFEPLSRAAEADELGIKGSRGTLSLRPPAGSEPETVEALLMSLPYQAILRLTGNPVRAGNVELGVAEVLALPWPEQPRAWWEQLRRLHDEVKRAQASDPRRRRRPPSWQPGLFSSFDSDDSLAPLRGGRDILAARAAVDDHVFDGLGTSRPDRERLLAEPVRLL